MKLIETFLKKQVYNAIIGKLNFKDESLAMVKSGVEDSDFMGREDSYLPAIERVNKILGNMTLEEKVKFLGGYEKLGIHAFPRLELPSIWCSDATSGLRSFPGGTAFLAGIAMAASWDEELIEELGAVIGEEFRAVGVSILLGPGVNIYRVPTCGRNFEYMGEDPFLAGKMSAAYIRGAQSTGILTTVKHFTANNSEFDRHKTDSVMSERTLREIYLPAFRIAVQEGGSWGVMSAYNPVNGTYASENKYLLTKILRDEWGFNGFVISDWNSLYSTVPAIKNGLNLEMPAGKWINIDSVKAAMERGDLIEEDIDAMLFPLMRSLFDSGVYDRPQVDVDAKIHTLENIEFALKAAESGITLLKNENKLLPLDPNSQKKIVVMGRTAINTPTGGGGSSYVHREDSIDILTGIKAEFSGGEIQFIPIRDEKLTSEQAELIRLADVVILASGFWTYEESECFDRSWYLPENQNKLIQKVSQLNPHTIVILTVGGGVETQSWIHEIPVLLHTFYLGEIAGSAIGRILVGKANPGGKLPFTMAKKWDDFASTKHYVKRPETVRLRQIRVGQGDPTKRKIRQMRYEEGLFVGYRHFDSAGIEPQFPFGHGLSYSNFELSDLQIQLESGFPRICLDVKNTSSVAGSEVVQCYVRDLDCPVERPDKELKAFCKVHLKAGEQKRTTLSLPRSSFEYFDEGDREWVFEGGRYEILIGTSSRDIIFSHTIEFST